MSSNQKNDSNAGWLGWLIGAAIVLAIVIYSVSAVGNLLDLTPTGSEVLDSEDGWVSAHYQGVAVGYVLTGLVIAFVVGGFFLWQWVRGNMPDEETVFWKAAGAVGVVLAVLVIALPVGARDTALDIGNGGGNDNGPLLGSSGPSADELQERTQERRRLARLERQREQRQAEQRQEAREKAQLAQQEEAQDAEPVEPQPAATSSCDPNYSGACLDPNAADYDCEGGEGDGPEYTGQVTVVGSDHYDLDTGDGDPAACEPY